MALVLNNSKIDKLAKCVLPHSGETKTASSISKICHSGNETKCFAPVGRKVNSERNEQTLLQAPILFRQDAQFELQLDTVDEGLDAFLVELEMLVLEDDERDLGVCQSLHGDGFAGHSRPYR